MGAKKGPEKVRTETLTTAQISDLLPASTAISFLIEGIAELACV
jgi:hypothetical protein